MCVTRTLSFFLILLLLYPFLIPILAGRAAAILLPMIVICAYFASIVMTRPFIDTRNLLQELLFSLIHLLIFAVCLAYLDEPWGHSDAVAVVIMLFTVCFFVS